MDNILAFSIDFYTWVVIPLLIFFARLADVSLGTIRVIFISRGLKYLAAVMGFFEVIIWLLAIGQIMKNLSSPICYIAYAGGFALGNFIGISIVEKLSLGVVLIRVITQKDATDLVNNLIEDGYRVTCIDGHGSTGQVKLVFTIVPRRQVKNVVTLIKKFNPLAFYSIEEIGFVEQGAVQPKKQSPFLSLFRPCRKGK